jgi:hypothetical protein
MNKVIHWSMKISGMRLDKTGCLLPIVNICLDLLWFTVMSWNVCSSTKAGTHPLHLDKTTSRPAPDIWTPLPPTPPEINKVLKHKSCIPRLPSRSWVEIIRCLQTLCVLSRWQRRMVRMYESFNSTWRTEQSSLRNYFHFVHQYLWCGDREEESHLRNVSSQ